LLVPPLAEAAGGPLEAAVYEPGEPPGPQRELALRRMWNAGARTVFTGLNWSAVAPQTRSPTFDPTNPNDAGYGWEAFDARLRSIVRHGFTPLVSVNTAPSWAEGGTDPRLIRGTERPDPTELGHFAKAAALRYSGRYPGLPRIRYWQIWAEQNLVFHLNPQRVADRLFAPRWYRQMLNAAAASIHSVHRDNIVITGGLAPFTTTPPELGIAPFQFMRDMLCLSKRLKRTCRERSHFDAWAHHPYTSGGPTHHAYRPDDVSLGDLPEMRRALMAAYRNGSIVSRRPPLFWVTEFSWDTRPPDPRGVPLKLHARWVAEGLYRMWTSGVTLVTWLQLRDEPISELAQGGLYFRGATTEQDRPKPALQAFRFPFVGFPKRGGVYVWGRTPAGKPGRVVVQQSFRGGWRRLGILRTNRHGIFEHRFASRPVGWVRARSLETRALARPFSLKHHPDQRFNPFGRPVPDEPG
jgi:hypothetical protein